ncbi:MAG: indolepyruvate oxidoreductase subunit beta [Candidatus Bipolaricaulota bacterium]|nr:MAG: indolepyruvate oxidoreductase subunit beta [Candidatus Bipolaricaulota bacterium]
MKQDVILAGVGGQGLLSAAAIIGDAAVHRGLHVKQAEVHGMAQRGGAVESHLRIADGTIHSDLIARGSADVILALEPMEALRYVPYLAPAGTIVTAGSPVENVDSYPDLDALLEALRAAAPTLVVDAAGLAREAGSARSANMVVAGAGAPLLALTKDELEAAIERLFAAKGQDVVETNVKAFRLGFEVGERWLSSSGNARGEAPQRVQGQGV